MNCCRGRKKPAFAYSTELHATIEALRRMPTESVFYFNGGVRRGAQRHGNQVYTLRGSELCNDTEDAECAPEPHSGQRRILSW